ncbi:MAG: hypothetical protein H6822_26445 [Planctomycetaceae bacterium]|nr:hypothetical protein [Planctomycetales bacterium]MCB9925718.1 hypothetical protein [Planctomycetaceae bacterium]
MYARQPKAAPLSKVTTAATLLLEIEMPTTGTFEAFQERFDSQLATLESRFSEFVTRNSLAASIGR